MPCEVAQRHGRVLMSGRRGVLVGKRLASVLVGRRGLRGGMLVVLVVRCSLGRVLVAGHGMWGYHGTYGTCGGTGACVTEWC